MMVTQLLGSPGKIRDERRVGTDLSLRKYYADARGGLLFELR